MLNNRENGGDDPVEDKPRLEVQGDDNRHDRHHVEHLLLHTSSHFQTVFFFFLFVFLFGVLNMGLDAGLHHKGKDKLSDSCQHGHDVSVVRLGKVQVKEMGVDQKSSDGRLFDELHEDLVEGNENNYLYYLRKAACSRIDTLLFVKGHLSHLKFFFVLVFFFEPVQGRLEFLHFFGRLHGRKNEGD
ncbi:MAG: hypothetical protein UW42_C0058G0010 [Candidatus Collierbacteria bacterium GW2011_GWB1_44_197]|nr:MAG: hypothetical protein UW42_C0058G0010 [Candidatus Collierbacteria bacterium GW2011_GWB1_44_197]KKT64976.1 MAG: hypothetical protein UW58_C0034G0009 [Candidatus Collierbacteria bacterium GW2011_GWC2_44_30]